MALAAACVGGGSPGSGPVPDADPTALIREDVIRSDLVTLAGDHFRGREAGTMDELRASMWLAERARQAGLEPAGDDGTWFQFWPLKMVRLAPTSTVTVGTTPLTFATEVIGVSLRTATVDGPIVLAGDGRPDTLDGLDLEGKVAVVRMSPPARVLPEKISLRQARYAMANVSERIPAIAAEKPLAIVLVADAVADSGWEFVAGLEGTYGLEFNESLLGVQPSVPVLWVRQRTLPLLSAPGQRFKATLIAERTVFPSVNVVARVRGTDPALRDEYVLFSAHQDHDGIKAPVAGDSIWNGADDNASVAVGILAIGRAWAKQPARRSALFVWHGAEEKGLLGSRYHAANPVVPLNSITAVLNADMIGANSPDSASLLGAQPPHLNSRELADMGLRANELVGRFALDTLWDRPTHPEGWYFRSDHVPYARLGIPSLYFSSLPHPLYHTPLDDPAHINYAKVTRITRWMSATGWMAANAPERVRPLSGVRPER